MRRELQAEPARVRKNRPRIANAGQRMELPPISAEAVRTSRRIAPAHNHQLEHHVEGGRRRAAADRRRHCDAADRPYSPRQRFAQRPDEQTPAIAGGAAIEDRQFNVA